MRSVGLSLVVTLASVMIGGCDETSSFPRGTGGAGGSAIRPRGVTGTGGTTAARPRGARRPTRGRPRPPRGAPPAAAAGPADTASACKIPCLANIEDECVPTGACVEQATGPLGIAANRCYENGVKILTDIALALPATTMKITHRKPS